MPGQNASLRRLFLLPLILLTTSYFQLRLLFDLLPLRTFKQNKLTPHISPSCIFSSNLLPFHVSHHGAR